MTKKRVMGNDGRMIWHIPEETALFKKTTVGSTLIMGRKTFEETGVLKKRKTIVVTRTIDRIDDADVCRNLEDALKKAQSYGRKIFIIGGGEIFAQAIDLADKMYLSYIKKDYLGNVFFPKFKADEWTVERKKDYKEFEQVIYVRK
jgi:dihydrofolate reductase